MSERKCDCFSGKENVSKKRNGVEFLHPFLSQFSAFFFSGLTAIEAQKANLYSFCFVLHKVSVLSLFSLFAEFELD